MLKIKPLIITCRATCKRNTVFHRTVTCFSGEIYFVHIIVMPLTLTRAFSPMSALIMKVEEGTSCITVINSWQLATASEFVQKILI